MSEKREAFVRLSEKRLDTIEDAVRIWSNLSGPSYEWTPDEVLAQSARITAAVGTAMARFQESKHWAAGMPQEAPEQPAEPDPAPEAPTTPAASITPRQAAMLRIWDEASNEEGALVEMLAMQREVIAGLQSDIDKLRDRKPPA
jgi:hypothetical protein